VVEHQQIELDYCPACEGVWFDAGELALLLETMKLADPEMTVQGIARLPAVATPGKTAKCPICGQALAEVAIGQPPINIDVCRNADGLWFDGGEVHQLLK
jgi:Zn-finger nucleic acid-binding protein